MIALSSYTLYFIYSAALIQLSSLQISFTCHKLFKLYVLDQKLNIITGYSVKLVLTLVELFTGNWRVSHDNHVIINSFFFQNDIWQAQTWSSIEYAGRWKLLHYAMKKVIKCSLIHTLKFSVQIYSDVSVSAYQLNGMIVIYVTVDDPQMSVKYSLSVDIISWDVSSICMPLVFT